MWLESKSFSKGITMQFQDCEDIWRNFGDVPREAANGRGPITPSEAMSLMGTILTMTAKARKTVTTARFDCLVKEWKANRPHSSSVEQLAMHSAYQQIIGLGPDAIPLILRELEVAPGHWFWALRAIAGENPVANEHRGDLRKMADDWFAWARRKGYRW